MPILPLLLFALTPSEQAILSSIDANTERSYALLESLTNQNSGTFHLPGVDAVAARLEPEFQKLGFTTSRIPIPQAKRAAHLLARHPGSRPAKPILLIGHIDTVFEPASPFQRFSRSGLSATGPGVADMKGGIVVILAALQALHATNQLQNLNLEVFLTSDEEDPGEPISISRGAFIEAGKRASAALCFETGARSNNQDFATTARRGYQGWELRVSATTGHSSRIFSENMGHGAAFELSRIISQFHAQLPEPNMTFNVGLLLAGTQLSAASDGASTASGKMNIVPAQALARGEVRALYADQLARIKDKMYAIVAKHLPGTRAELHFEENSPPMSPTPGNKRLLSLLNDASQRASLGPVGELDPMLRGAGDISYIAAHVDSLSGLGASGNGAHAPGESVDLASIPKQAKRAALLLLAIAAK